MDSQNNTFNVTPSLYITVATFHRARFWLRKARKQVVHRLTAPIRNIYFEWQARMTYFNPKRNYPHYEIDYSKSVLHLMDLHTCWKIEHVRHDHELALIRRYKLREEDFNLFTELDLEEVPLDRLPANGITILPYRYHGIPAGNIQLQGKDITVDDTDLSGLPPHPKIYQLIHDWFPMFLPYLDLYCRPPSLGPQAFRDFNKATVPIEPMEDSLHQEILDITFTIFGVKPYRPLHYAEAEVAGSPLSTSASYHDKFSILKRLNARHSSPVLYNKNTFSKGYYFNVLKNEFRLELHYIKEFGTPFDSTDMEENEIHDRLRTYFLSNPAQLFIRSQISKRDPSEPKKIRPVYAVPSRYLELEKITTTQLLCQLRNPSSCVMHGMETFRGAMKLIDLYATWFESYVMIDWTSFDQYIPRFLTRSYHLEFLPSLITVDKGYYPSLAYPDSSQNTDSFARKFFNICYFMNLWYENMVFISYDGYSYHRDNAGISSGELNTQSKDSWCNLYIIIDALIKFKFTKTEILEMIFFIMGDDNVIFFRRHYDQIHMFLPFLEDYSQARYGMVLSILKSLATSLRSKIEVLSYTNNYGFPIRNSGRLVALLAFPERPIPKDKEWIHATRCLGIAYANCGHDYHLHLLCQMGYEAFKQEQPVPISRIKKHLPLTIFEAFGFESTEGLFSFPEFPTFFQIRQSISYYHGFFHEDDHWPRQIFGQHAKPSDPEHNGMTLIQWMKQNNIKFPPTCKLFTRLRNPLESD